MSRKSSKWDALRTSLPSAWSIEETGLDTSVDAEKYAFLNFARASLSTQRADIKSVARDTGRKSSNYSHERFDPRKETFITSSGKFGGEVDGQACKNGNRKGRKHQHVGTDYWPKVGVLHLQEEPLGRMNTCSEIEMEERKTHDVNAAESSLCPSVHDETQLNDPLQKVSSQASSRATKLDILPPRIGARNRWRRLKNTVAFANHMAANVRASNDFLEERGHDSQPKSDAGRVGAAAFEGTKAAPQVKAKGRKGMEGLIVEQDKSYISYFQDFYVACLKMPALHFFIGVFLAPVALGLLFTPFYLADVDGLSLSDPKDEQRPVCDASAKWSCLNVFLYALSLSTTFGGSPIAALSPFCLLIANLHTLMGQFLFVFLSGAVFARMSQPAHPIRCSKKAIIKDNDFSTDHNEEDEKFKVFVVRMVLTGPPPCELVDAKIRLTFRIFVRLPSGSMFCSTQDLELVRSEVAYLRYGLTVRHIINAKSPIYGHTIDSLVEGDASFSLTIMGVERSSMQPIFHLEDYFVCDGDITWDGDYLDFVRVNEKGQRVLDHSKIDMLKPFKVAGVVSQAIARMEGDVARHKAELEKELNGGEGMLRPSVLDWKNSGTQIRKMWKSMSSSFTRGAVRS